MAQIKTINIEDGKVTVNFSVTQKEYDLIKENGREFAILPLEKMKEHLTTGKLGNSNRIMIPKKFLERNGVSQLLKHVKARIFETDGHKVLLVKLDENRPGVPVFE